MLAFWATLVNTMCVRFRNSFLQGSVVFKWTCALSNSIYDAYTLGVIHRLCLLRREFVEVLNEPVNSESPPPRLKCFIAQGV